MCEHLCDEGAEAVGGGVEAPVHHGVAVVEEAEAPLLVSRPACVPLSLVQEEARYKSGRLEIRSPHCTQQKEAYGYLVH